MTVPEARVRQPSVHAERPTSGPPPDWTGTHARSSGWVVIPEHVDPTNPCRVYELDDPAQRINGHIDRGLLADMWERLYRPDNVRAAWTQVIRAVSDGA